MKLVAVCADCGGYVHRIMPWQTDWKRKVDADGRWRGRLRHKSCEPRTAEQLRLLRNFRRKSRRLRGSEG